MFRIAKKKIRLIRAAPDTACDLCDRPMRRGAVGVRKHGGFWCLNCYLAEEKATEGQIKMADVFVRFLLAQYVVVCGCYAYQGAWAKACYWLGATIVTIGVLKA